MLAGIASSYYWREFWYNKLLFRNLRYPVYKQFTWWLHNKLGKEIRSVETSCVVYQIQTKFPEDDGRYVPFAKGQAFITSFKKSKFYIS